MAGHSRQSRDISKDSEKRIIASLTREAAGGDLVALRTQAIALLLWDGVVRTRGAVALNRTDFRPRRKHGQLRVDGREVTLSPRAVAALDAYVRRCPKPPQPLSSESAPLFLSTRQPDKRLSQRTAVHAWRRFLADCVPEFEFVQLDDLVFSGRLRFMRSGHGIEELIAHAGVSREWANHFRDLAVG